MSLIKIDDLLTLKYNYKISEKKYNTINISLFKMKNSYREFKIYTDGILEIFKHYKKYFPDFILRIYFDDSVIDNKDFIKLYNILDNNKQQLIHYNCQKFKLDKKYHRGIFGMMIRFLPYFDFKNNDTNISLVLDAEPYSLKKIKNFLEYFSIYINKFIYSDAKFFRHFKICDRSPWAPIHENFILGYMNASKYKFPLDLLTNFLNNKIYNIKNEYPKVYNESINYKKNNDNIFFYGVDEFFLSVILKLYLDDKKIKYMTYKTCYVNIHFYYTLLEIIFKNYLNNNNKTKYDKITQIINKKTFKKFKDFNSILEYIGKKYDYNRKTDKHKVYKILRNIIIKIHETNINLFNLLNINNYECLFLTDKYYDDTNNLTITN